MSSISRDHFHNCIQQFSFLFWGKRSCFAAIVLFFVTAQSNFSPSSLYGDEKVEANSPGELVTKQEEDSLKVMTPDFYKALGRSSLSQSEIQVIKDYIRIQVLQMSRRDNQVIKKGEEKTKTLSGIRKKVKQSFIRAKQPAIDVLLPEITKQCMKLIDQPLPVRMNAVMLITELNQTKANIGKKLAAIPYEGKADELVAILNDPKQLQAVKVIAVNGLNRLCRDGYLKVTMRKSIATSLVREARKKDIEAWYKRVCVGALGVVDDLYDPQRRPYVIQTLCEILIDSKQHWRVRAEAARSLGRVKMDGQINFQLINYEIARFTYEMAKQYNQRPRIVYWKISFFQVYSAYRKINEKDTALLDRTGKAPLSKHKTSIEAAYKNILPVVNSVTGTVTARKIPAKTLASLKDFVEKNKPNSFSITPSSKPLRQAAVAKK